MRVLSSLFVALAISVGLVTLANVVVYLDQSPPIVYPSEKEIDPISMSVTSVKMHKAHWSTLRTGDPIDPRDLKEIGFDLDSEAGYLDTVSQVWAQLYPTGEIITIMISTQGDDSWTIDGKSKVGF